MACNFCHSENRKPKKHRLDQLLVTRGLADSRAKAQALILAGGGVGGQGAAGQGGTLMAPDSPLSLKSPPSPYIWRAISRPESTAFLYHPNILPIVALSTFFLFPGLAAGAPIGAGTRIGDWLGC